MILDLDYHPDLADQFAAIGQLEKDGALTHCLTFVQMDRAVLLVCAARELTGRLEVFALPADVIPDRVTLVRDLARVLNDFQNLRQEDIFAHARPRSRSEKLLKLLGFEEPHAPDVKWRRSWESQITPNKSTPR